jgi:hypothetical protein
MKIVQENMPNVGMISKFLSEKDMKNEVDINPYWDSFMKNEKPPRIARNTLMTIISLVTEYVVLPIRLSEKYFLKRKAKLIMLIAVNEKRTTNKTKLTAVFIV